MGGMKSGIRFAAFASGPIGADKHATSGRTAIVAVVAKKDEVEGILSSRIGINATDSTAAILKMIARSRFRDQIKLVVLNGIALAGLNIVDAERLKAKGLELMVITRHKPRPPKLVYALNTYARKSKVPVGERIKIVKNFAKWKLEKISGFYVKSTMQRSDYTQIYEHALGMLRLSHLIASGISKGESKGRM
ncbi:MAG: DUF99 family protein [Candidatus Micrarchaeaceae archaeon]